MGSHESNSKPQPNIPIISSDTLEALRSQFSDNSGDGQSWGDRLTDMQTELIEKNPHLVDFINQQVGRYPVEFHQPMFEVLMATLVLIERQAEADIMNTSFPDIDT